MSAFAFQGTNAHAVMSISLRSPPVASHGPVAAWMGGPPHGRRHWALPPAHALLRHAALLSAAATSRGAAMLFEADSAAPALTFLQDHRVRGLALLPATAMSEMFAGAGSIAVQVGAHAFLSPFNQSRSSILRHSRSCSCSS